jgi:hypothetical protein
MRCSAGSGFAVHRVRDVLAVVEYDEEPAAVDEAWECPSPAARSGRSDTACRNLT